MEEADHDSGFVMGPPALVSLAAFSPFPSPSPRRLSSNFIQPGHPVPLVRRMAYVSLQGRLVNAEKASSALAIGGSLSSEEAVAWELFSPIQRFLIVAVIGVAVAESKKNRLIRQLRKSVDLRDQVLSTMQQKLDNLCEQLSNVKEQSVNKTTDSLFTGNLSSDKISFIDCGCWLCDQHHDVFTGLVGTNVMKARGEEKEMLPVSTTFPSAAVAEQEERRMSDLSDWSFSVASSAELQLNNLAIEHDIFNLKKECEEKDATIKELTSFLQSSNVAGPTRISELEDIIRRKNMIITRLKKDMMVLEQKVVNLTRQRRPSSTSSSDSWQLPAMTENLLYDMDSTTSPSSSDSDSSPTNQPHAPSAKVVSVQGLDLASSLEQKSVTEKSSSYLAKANNIHISSLSVTPLKELSTNQKLKMPSSPKQRQLSSVSEDFKKSKRRIPTASKGAASQKRWA